MKTKIKNGKEYIQYPDSTRWVLLFTLDDGQKITVNELSDKLSCAKQCARSRLRRKKRQDGGGSTNRGVFAFDPNTWYVDPLVKLMLK